MAFYWAVSEPFLRFRIRVKRFARVDFFCVLLHSNDVFSRETKKFQRDETEICKIVYNSFINNKSHVTPTGRKRAA